MPLIDEKLLILVLFLTIPIVMRIRRDLGWQKTTSRRLLFRRIGLVLLALMLSGILFLREPILAALAWAISLSLTSLSLRMTTFESRDDGTWFRTNPWIGGTLAAIVVGRIVYRLFTMRAVSDMVMGPDGAGIQLMSRSPLSLALALLIISYFGVYYNLVVRRAGNFIPQDQ